MHALDVLWSQEVQIAKDVISEGFTAQARGECETKLVVSTGSASSTQTNLFNNFRSFTGRQLGEVFLAEFFFGTSPKEIFTSQNLMRYQRC